MEGLIDLKIWNAYFLGLFGVCKGLNEIESLTKKHFVIKIGVFPYMCLGVYRLASPMVDSLQFFIALQHL